MYDDFYGFTCRPFSLLPDPSFLYLSRKHRTALALLEYGLLNQAGFTVISGEVGCGKTTLIRHLLEGMESDVRVGLITNTHEHFGELLEWVHLAFDLERGEPGKVALYRQLAEFARDEHRAGRRAVLIVDEAQNLSLEALEELRLLSNLNTEDGQVLQLILVGQPELLEKLRRPELRQLVQRVAVDYYLPPLDERETRGYVQHRCQVAGVRSGPFRGGALARIHAATGGVPRLINLVCDTALVYGYGLGRRSIGGPIVDAVVRDRLHPRGVFSGHLDTGPPVLTAPGPTLTGGAGG